MADQVQMGGSAGTPTPGTPPTGATVSDAGGGPQRVTVNSAPPDAGSKQPETPARPDWLPEKFKTVEDLAKSYKELEAKLGGGKKPEDPTPAKTKIETPPTDKAVTDAGFDLAKLNAEFIENGGKLTDKTMESLAAKGFGKDMVEAYVEGQKARANAYTAKVADSVGGQDQMQAIFDWAAKNLSPEEINVANQALTSMDEARATLTLAGLQNRFLAATGSEPGFVKGAQGARSPGVEPFRDQSEITQAMSNPLYKTSPAYRAKVAARLAATDNGSGVNVRSF